MTTFHAVVWIDQQQAHVLMFDREHVESQRIKSRSHHQHQGKANDVSGMFADVAKALQGVHEVLLTGPGLTHGQFREWSLVQQPSVGKVIVGSVSSDHPTDPQLVSLARQYFKKFDRMGANPSAL